METASAAAAPAPADERRVISRRTYLIDKTFQLKYTAIIVAIGSAISLLFGFWMYRAHREATEILRLQALAENPALQQEVAARDTTVLVVFLGIALLMAVALGLFGVLVTHRVAGPIYVISRYLDEIANGVYPTIRPLRKGDDLRNFFDSFQRAIESLRKHDSSDARLMETAIKELTEFHQAKPELMSAEVEAELAKLKKVRDRKLQRLSGSPQS